MRRFGPFIIGLGWVIASSGCVAINVPSRRFHDTNDRGGLLGPWASADCQTCGNEPIDGTEWLTESMVDDQIRVEAAQATKPDPVPWPRYHPIPTRPAFEPAVGGY